MHYRIHALNSGWQDIDLGAYFYMGKFQGVIAEIPTFCFYLEGGGRKIMVDTGMCDSERAAKYHHAGRGQLPDEEILARLDKAGVTPSEIDMVIFTHLHWDHCSNMKVFKNAQFVVHRREYEFAIDPLPPYYRSYEHPILGIRPPFEGVQFEFTTGEEQVVDGIRVFPSPGHCPGHQSVVVDTEIGPVILAGDAVLGLDNLKPDPDRHMPITPLARFTNVIEMWNSLMDIKSRGGIILPSHEMSLFQKLQYP